jgi:mannose-1-phosphate guanylyltransferase
MIGVVLCGGVGARLWPVSRELYPKPFIRLGDGQSFIKKTFIKAAALPYAEGVYVVANRRLYFKLAEEYAASGVPLEPTFILEPCGRNTAPAIASAALMARAAHGPDMPLLVLPSDHLIDNLEAFRALVEKALVLAGRGRLVTFGIRPARPETGFGYLEAEGEDVLRFVEKPNLEQAKKYLASGRFLWNSGIFCFQAGVLLEELGRHAPEVLRSVEACLAASTPNLEGGGRVELEEESFALIPEISIDYAVLEKSKRVSVVAGTDLGWSDIGSWPELCGLRPSDAAGNRVSHPEKAVLEDVRDCLIDNHVNLVAALGVHDLLIVDTEDALLVADKARSQDVRLIYERLKAENRKEALHHPTVFKPWGYYTLLEEGRRFKTKLIALKPGARISLQLHHHRSEHWIVVSGLAEVTRDEEVFFVNTNESIYIKAGTKHRVANPGRIELVLIEVQSGDYLGEDDIVRFEDEYGRA